MAFKLKTKNHLYGRSLDKNNSVFQKHEAGHTETTTSGEWSDWVQDPNNPERYTRNRTNTTTSTTGGKGKGNTGVSYEDSYKNADKSKYPTLDSWKKYVDSYNKGTSSTSSNVETQEKFVTPKMTKIPTIPIKPIEMDPPEVNMTPITPGELRIPRKPRKPSLIDKIRRIDLIDEDKFRNRRRRAAYNIKRGLRRLNPFRPRRKGPCWYN